MKLYEHEAKKLLEKRGLKVPEKEGEAYVVKAQVLASDRKKHGGIKFPESKKEAEKIAEEMKKSKIKGHEVNQVLIEEQIDIQEEYYIAFFWDTELRRPVMLSSEDGGSGIENREVQKTELGEENNFEELEEDLRPLAEKLFETFLEEDIEFLEVNPLAFDRENFVVVDAMIELEDDASFRHEWDFPERTEFAREKTEREIEAEKIDEDDHRGVAGKYTELEGDIGMMLAGGGASLTNMDALIEAGGKPANYTEYGGNPPTEKVYRLSKIIMSKELNGLLHVGGTANNTNILRTMKGFIQALREEKPDYPIVVRRDGPQADEAFELLLEVREELGLDMKLYRNDLPMTESAEKLMEMIEE
ncbi:citryl-CoA synthetase large subunit [Candidatus Haloredivivus sp. G17]|nr:citryl-CoA synthetase large subunit [Candidatus Haloredivivus sp. G17]